MILKFQKIVWDILVGVKGITSTQSPIIFEDVYFHNQLQVENKGV